MGLYGPNVIKVEENNTTDISCASTETIYTKAYELKRGSVFGVAYKATSSAGSINITIVVEQGYQAPTSPEASDATFVTPSGMADVCTNRTTETTLVIQSLSPVVMPWIRFKCVGAGSNNADTLVNIWLAIQES